MRIGFVTDGTLAEFERSNRVWRSDVYLLSFGSVGEVNYEKEVQGETAELEEIALFSRNFRCVTVCGCYTDTKGIKRRSAVVAEGGRILGVSDMTASVDGDKYKCGYGVRVYETSAGNIGVIVGKDVFFPELVSSLVRCGSDAVVCMYEEVGDSLESVVLRSHAFCYGTPMAMCARGYAFSAGIGGKVDFASPRSPCFFTPEKRAEYHLVQTRRRGFHKIQETF